VWVLLAVARGAVQQAAAAPAVVPALAAPVGVPALAAPAVVPALAVGQRAAALAQVLRSVVHGPMRHRGREAVCVSSTHNHSIVVGWFDEPQDQPAFLI
jgi:hypothetical protein